MSRRVCAAVLACLLPACVRTTGGGGDTTPCDEASAVYTELPVEEETPAAASAEEAPTAAEPAAEEPGGPGAGGGVGPAMCRLDPADPAAARQLAVFRRWLRDQAVGRATTIEDVQPVCGDRDGMLVSLVTASGPSGGLQSLAHALDAYYPGASWLVQRHERLEGDDVPLRIAAEVRIPVGAVPRPRCTWDPATPCPGSQAAPETAPDWQEP